MKKIKSVFHSIHAPILLYLITYTLLSLQTLTDFPWVHSDESWLAGLTRNMMETTLECIIIKLVNTNEEKAS